MRIINHMVIAALFKAKSVSLKEVSEIGRIISYFITLHNIYKFLTYNKSGQHTHFTWMDISA